MTPEVNVGNESLEASVGQFTAPAVVPGRKDGVRPEKDLPVRHGGKGEGVGAEVLAVTANSGGAVPEHHKTGRGRNTRGLRHVVASFWQETQRDSGTVSKRSQEDSMLDYR